MAIGPFSSYSPPGFYGIPYRVTWPDGTRAGDDAHQFERVGERVHKFVCSGCGMSVFRGSYEEPLDTILGWAGVPARCKDTVIMAVMRS